MSGMKIIKPTVITDAALVSSTVPEPDVSAGEILWSPDVTYQVGNVVVRISTHTAYMRKSAGKTPGAPESDSDNWKVVGPTNRWGGFDRKVGTAATATTSMTYVLRPGGIGGIGMLELTGRRARVQVKTAPGGPLVYDKVIELDGTLITSVYDWFFADYEQLTDVVLTDLPQQYPNCELTVQLTGAVVSVGVLQVGQVIEVGSAQYGASVGIVDYSIKKADDFGNWDVFERNYSKRCTLQVLTSKADFNKLYRRLAALRATPCIYIGADQAGYEPMISYGFYKDFGITVNYPQHHLLNIEIEGL
jgi:hypothetical protein